MKIDLQFAERENFRFEAELKMKASQHEVITVIRPLLVAGAFTSCPSAKTASDACRQLVRYIMCSLTGSKTTAPAVAEIGRK